jgi:hypothetical protein
MSPDQNKSSENAVGVEKKSRFSFKNKKVKIVLASLGALVVLGGIGAAAYVNSVYNRPENVLASAMGKYLLDGKDKSFDSTINVKLLDEGAQASGITEVEFKLGVQTSGKTVQADVELNVAVFSIKGAVQANENGNIYVQVKDLPALLGSDVATAYGIPEEMKEQIAALDEKWVEITKEDLANLTNQPVESGDTLDRCTEAIYGALESEDLANDFDKFYRKNKFLLANNPTEEVVNGKKLLKVDVGIDEEKAGAFGREFGNLQQVKDLFGACGLNSGESAVEEAEDDLSNGKMTVWLDRGKRELVRLEASGDGFDQETKTNEVKFSMEVKEPGAKLEAPSEVVNIKELMEMFGIDPSMLQGLGETSGA